MRMIGSNEMGTTYEETATIGGVDVGDASNVATDRVAREDVFAQVAGAGLPERHDTARRVADLELLDAVAVDAVVVDVAARASPNDRRCELAPRRTGRVSAPAAANRRRRAAARLRERTGQGGRLEELAWHDGGRRGGRGAVVGAAAHRLPSHRPPESETFERG